MSKPVATFVDPPEDPSALWKTVGGRNWVASQQLVDHLFQPIEVLLAEAVQAQSPRRVLDIGCGTGGTTRTIHRHTQEGGYATGVDVAEVMIDAARQGGEQDGADKEGLGPGFLCADAARYDFQEGLFDMLVSRFGVMFFEDPVRAFQNLRRAASKEATALFFSWRSPKETPFMTTAGRAAKSIVTLPQQDRNAPGQFAFADPQRVESILESAGWHNISIEPLDFECAFPETELVNFFTRIGPLGRILPGLDENTQAQLITVVREAFEPFVFGDTVKFNAACWQIKAKAS